MKTLAPLVVAGVVASLATVAVARERAPLRTVGKVDARVLQDTRGGRRAHFIIVLRDQARLAGAADAAPARQALGRLAVDRLRAAAQSQRPLLAELALLRAPHRPFWIVNAVAVTGRRSLVDRLAARADVVRIEADRAFRGLTGESAAPAPDSARAPEWNIQKINADDVWAQGFRGQGTVYANADTGVSWTHPALKRHYRGWNDATATADHNYNWHDAIHTDISGNASNPCGFNTTQPCDDNLHGTHTMGTAVGDDGAGNQIGVAPDAKWMSCRNMDEGVGRPSTYIECLQFFVAPTTLGGGAPNPDLRPDAIGNSYGCPPDEQCQATSLLTAVDNVRAAGIFMAVSAGNSGSACSTVSDPPAIYDSSITVGSTNISDLIAASSSRGPVLVDASGRPKPDLVAPGVSVRSSVPGGLYQSLSGTSMASPHVGGAVLLLWSAVPRLRRDVDATEALLEQTAVKLTTLNGCGGNSSSQIPNNTYGYGRIDVLAAYQAAQAPTSAGSVTLSGTTVGEGGKKGSTASVEVRLAGGANGGVSIRYRTENGTAKAGYDYVGRTGTLTLGAGTTVQRIAIRILPDRRPEPNEQFTVLLRSATNATLTKRRATVTIIDDDPPPPRYSR